MADYATEIEVRSDGEAEREEITYYDEVQDYLYPTVPTPKEKGKKSSNSWMVSITTRRF